MNYSVRCLYRYFLYPLAFLILQLLRPFLNSKTQEMIRDKKHQQFKNSEGLSSEQIRAARPFWIHAASGEIEYARPVIRELRKRYPLIPVLVTYSSPSAKKMLTNLDGVSAWGPLPWDFQDDCEKFLKLWQPRCLLIARTDVWPVMAESCYRFKIPSLLFSATFAENSSRLRGLSAEVTKWALNKLSAVHCVSDEDVYELQKLKLTVPVSVQGDTRFDQVFHRLQNPRNLNIAARPRTTKPVLVAGSTWPEDEAVVIAAYLRLKSSIRLILVPHEVDEDHLARIETTLTDHGVPYHRYSKVGKAPAAEDSVLIVDQVGILAELYTWGHLAFVGGSFRKQVHSVMEPLAVGLPVFVGPYHHNNREALVFKKIGLSTQPAVSEVSDPTDLVEKISNFIGQPTENFGIWLKGQVLNRSHSSEAVLAWVHSQNATLNT